MDKTNIDNELIEVITPVRLKAYGNGNNSILLNEYVYNLKIIRIVLSGFIFIENCS